VIEVELDPAQLEQVLGEIAELRAEVERLVKRVQILQNQLDAGPLPEWRA
jgi:ubiquinone biosynthesis protein UbiJ